MSKGMLPPGERRLGWPCRALAALCMVTHTASSAQLLAVTSSYGSYGSYGAALCPRETLTGGGPRAHDHPQRLHSTSPGRMFKLGGRQLPPPLPPPHSTMPHPPFPELQVSLEAVHACVFHACLARNIHVSRSHDMSLPSPMMPARFLIMVQPVSGACAWAWRTDGLGFIEHL